jgi:DnaD/phage-associated family protein
MRFTGFVQGTRATAVPDPMLGSLLEQIQDLAELKVVLRGVWLRNQKKGSFRPVFIEEFLSDRVLLRGLAGDETSPEQRILRGLALAVQHKVFLYCPAGDEQPTAANAPAAASHDELFLLNTHEDREVLTLLRLEASGDFPAVVISAPGGLAEPPPEARPNIFALFEDNIGTIGPVIAELLKAAEAQYPATWIAEAFGIAIAQNKRSWAYIEAILRRWTAEGKDHGEPGRHSPQDHRQKYSEQYERWRGHVSQERRDS